MSLVQGLKCATLVVDGYAVIQLTTTNDLISSYVVCHLKSHDSDFRFSLTLLTTLKCDICSRSQAHSMQSPSPRHSLGELRQWFCWPVASVFSSFDVIFSGMQTSPLMRRRSSPISQSWFSLLFCSQCRYLCFLLGPRLSRTESWLTESRVLANVVETPARFH